MQRYQRFFLSRCTLTMEIVFFFISVIVIIVSFLSRHQHIIQIRKSAAVFIFIAGILFGLLLLPVIKLLAECLVNSFLQEPDSEQGFEDEGLGKDEVDEDDGEEKKNR